MFYIDALNLINLCIEHGILTEHEGHVLIIHENGPVLWDKDLLAHELMQDFEGQDVLLSALEEKHIQFKPFDFGPFNEAYAMFGPDGKYPTLPLKVVQTQGCSPASSKEEKANGI